MECDHLAPIAMFPDRLFHTHAKDTLVDKAARAYVGVYGSGWWRYVIPGFGNINWGEYISHLRHAGYDGVLSIEHEDQTQTPEEGFMRGAAFLEQFC
jgi:sugar phosphate isomerase/epimerase